MGCISDSFWFWLLQNRNERITLNQSVGDVGSLKLNPDNLWINYY